MNAAFRAKARLPAEVLAAFRLGPGRAKRKTNYEFLHREADAETLLD
jgi:hypothetical protein